MNRTRMLVLASFALILSVGITVVVYTMLRDRLQPSDDTVSIVVAAQNVALGARLTPADIRLAPWPRAVAMDGSFKDLAEVLERGVIVPMIANEPILESKLAPKNGGAGLTAAIPDGMRAVGVKVNDVIGVAGFVVAGTRVDVILSGSPNRNTNNLEMSKVILENVQVLAAGQNVTRDADGKPLNVQVVTLLVTPDESQKLALASLDGKIQLALRNPLDLDRMDPQAIRRDSLYGIPGPAPIAQTPRAPMRRAAAPIAPKVETPAPIKSPVMVVQLIQGTKSETIVLGKKD